MTHLTCRLTAKNWDQLRNPTLGNRVWATFTFLIFRHTHVYTYCCSRTYTAAAFNLLSSVSSVQWTRTLAPDRKVWVYTGRFMTLLINHNHINVRKKAGQTNRWTTDRRVMRCWCGYLSEERCRLFTYGPADATASQTPSSLAPLKSRLVLPFGYGLTQVVLEKRLLNGCTSSSSSQSNDEHVHCDLTVNRWWTVVSATWKYDDPRLNMSQEGAARVWHVQPRVVIFPCRTNYRVSYVSLSDQLQETWIICKLKSFSPLHLHDLILKTDELYSVCLKRYAILVIKKCLYRRVN